MSLQTNIDERTAKLAEILSRGNSAVAQKRGAAASDLSGLPAAIESIPEGGSDVMWQEITINPAPTDTVVSAAPGTGIRKVTVPGDVDLIPSNIRSGVGIYGVTGSYSGDAPSLQIARFSENGTYTADSGYDGFGTVTVAVEAEGSVIPEPYATYIAEAEAVYTGDYANVIYAEGYGADTGVIYHTVMFLLDNWTISAYDAATTGYTHSGFMMVQKEDEGEWVLTDYSSTSTDTHYAKNIKAASCYITYNDMTLFPVGIGCYPDTTAINYANWDSGSFTETLETGDVLTYTVAFDGSGQPTTITAPDGTTTAITWEASE